MSNVDDLLNQIDADHLGKKPKKSGEGIASKLKNKIGNSTAAKKVGAAAVYIKDKTMDYLSEHKKLTAYVVSGAIVAGAVGFWLGVDKYSKRQDLPIRDILFRGVQTLSASGKGIGKNEVSSDRTAVTNINIGNEEGRETKSQGFWAQSRRHITDDQEDYFLLDRTNTMIASSNVKHERLQANIGFRGSITFKEETANLNSEYFAKTAPEITRHDATVIYRFEPERSSIPLSQVDELKPQIIKDHDKFKLVHLLTETRSMGQGWWIKNDGNTRIPKRAGTSLEIFDTSDVALNKEFFSLIDKYNSNELKNGDKARDKLLDKIQETLQNANKIPVYYTFEDGIMDWQPQGSTMYIGHKPSLIDRVGIDALLTAQLPNKMILPTGVIRVENQWDFFPGNYWLFNSLLRYESADGKRVFSLADKTNNGGYVAKDNKGVLARIDIEDFLLKYDHDEIYHYFLDLDGNGKINEDTENIGNVAFRVTRGQFLDLGKTVGADKDNRDVSYLIQYTFMAGSKHGEIEKIQDFMLCRKVESMFVDAVNKGYGKDSNLGFINEVGSDIALALYANNPQYQKELIPELNRALTEESALTAPRDMALVFQKAKREYAKDFANKVRVEFPVKEDTLRAIY